MKLSSSLKEIKYIKTFKIEQFVFVSGALINP